MENPETGLDLSCLKTFNEEDEILDMSSTPKENIFKNLVNLIMIGVGLNFKCLTQMMDYFQNLEELVVCRNNCNDFENMDLSKYQNIKRINLEANNIEDHHKLERISQLPKLTKLTLLNNNLTVFRQGENYKNLTSLVASNNKFNSGKCFSQFGKIPKLRHFKFRGNPYCLNTNKRHVLQWAIAENENVRFYNGEDIHSYEVTDAQYYIMRYAFHEFFRIFEKDQFSYKFTNFEKWATEHMPIALKMIEKYENPYPELDEKLRDADNGPVPGQGNNPHMNFIEIFFSVNSGPFLGKDPVPKKYPITTDFLYIRNWVSYVFNIKQKDKIIMQFKVRQNDVFDEIDDLSKGLDFYGFKDGTQVTIDVEGGLDAMEEK